MRAQNVEPLGLNVATGQLTPAGVTEQRGDRGTARAGRRPPVGHVHSNTPQRGEGMRPSMRSSR